MKQKQQSKQGERELTSNVNPGEDIDFTLDDFERSRGVQFPNNGTCTHAESYDLKSSMGIFWDNKR